MVHSEVPLVLPRLSVGLIFLPPNVFTNMSGIVVWPMVIEPKIEFLPWLLILKILEMLSDLQSGISEPITQQVALRTTKISIPPPPTSQRCTNEALPAGNSQPPLVGRDGSEATVLDKVSNTRPDVAAWTILTHCTSILPGLHAIAER